MNIKLKAYKALIDTLTDIDKKKEMKFVRCTGELEYPKIFSAKKFSDTFQKYSYKESGYEYGTNN